MARNSFIVRVYDQPVTNNIKNKVDPMTGIVEYADTGMKYTFNNKDELWKFMADCQDKIIGQHKSKG